MIAKAVPQLSLSNKSTLVAVSGSGNVAQYTVLKLIELGATVLSMSDSKGLLLAPEGGFTRDFVLRIQKLKLQGDSLDSISEHGYKYLTGEDFALL